MIPRKIFQTFEHGNFEPQFQYIVNDWKLENPDYEYHFYNAEDRQIFMKHYFSGKVYDAYTRIKPGAFKSDLWRYCVLYVHGGFYIDIDSICLGTLDMFVKKDTEFVAATDLNLGDLEYHNVANAFIGSTPGHPILKNCINHIIELVEKEELPAENIMNFCGPGCLGMQINKFLGREEKASMVRNYGKYGKVELISFEHPTEFFRALDGRKIMQNKNSSPFLKDFYKIECDKVENYFDWGKFGFKDVPFDYIVEKQTNNLDSN
tara:strand:- start:2195 stop:2983 length:789 start_codon:yes stop_codon:yes gene_type:complete